MLRRLPCLALPIVLYSSACSRGEIAPPSSTTRDSAGITIVESARSAWPEAEVWTVAPEPHLAIGLLEGDPAYLFGSVAGTTRLRDGTIVVADGQALEIRFFDSSGRFLHAVGRSGEGPGEFSRIASLWQCGGGRIYVDDWSIGRITVLQPDGTLDRTDRIVEPVGEDRRRPYRTRCSPGGAYLAVGWGDHPDFETLPQADFYRQDAAVWVLDSIGQPLAELGQHLVSERIFVRGSGGGGTSGPHPFGRQASLAIGRDRAYIGTGERVEVREFALDGRQLRIFRGPPEDLTMADDVLARYLNEDSAGSVAFLLQEIQKAGIELPREVPGFDEMKLDPEGHLWVRRFQFPWSDVERWGIFAPGGEFMGHVSIPERTTVHEIGRDYVLGVVKDELEVERVVLHTLTRHGFATGHDR